MRKNATAYVPFLSNDESFINIGESFSSEVEHITCYCQREVEPMGKEVEQPQIHALCTYLGIQTTVEYLDGRCNTYLSKSSIHNFKQFFLFFSVLTFYALRPFSGSLSNVNILEGDSIRCPYTVTLLYRPGHYDILYCRH